MLAQKDPKASAKYYCELCDFKSRNKTMFERHIDTAKHKRRKAEQNGAIKYCCKKCNYYSNDKTKFDRHLKTNKHKKNSEQTEFIPNESGTDMISESDFQTNLIDRCCFFADVPKFCVWHLSMCYFNYSAHVTQLEIQY